jgi:acyl carrier protein
MHGDPTTAASTVEPRLRLLLADVLGLPTEQVAAFSSGTELFGSLPELDSLAVANLLTGIEDRFGLIIEDDGVEAEDFATFGTLMDFIRRQAR